MKTLVSPSVEIEDRLLTPPRFFTHFADELCPEEAACRKEYLSLTSNGYANNDAKNANRFLGLEALEVHSNAFSNRLNGSSQFNALRTTAILSNFHIYILNVILINSKDIGIYKAEKSLC